MKNPITCFTESSSEGKQFIITVIILAVIVLGTFFYAFMRIDSVRSGKQIEQVQ